MPKFPLPLILLATVLLPELHCQQDTSSVQVYDAVVIKLNNGMSHGTSVDMDETTFRARNVPLKHLLVVAYGIREGLIYGLPAWASSLRYDITAKVTDPDLKTLRKLSHQQQQEMLTAILVDRFHLKAHIEVKTLPVYELVVAKDSSKLTPSAAPSSDGTDLDHLNLGKMNVNNTDITATEVTLSQLAGNLAFPLDRTVIDKTSLTGRYDFRLRWTADNIAKGTADNPVTDAPPNLFTAIQEQLGLKLQPAKGPVETLVIDHVEQSTEN